LDKRTEIIYLGKVRHNLKNPINAILGYSEMLIEDCEDFELTNLIPDLEKINHSGKSILKIIENNFKDEELNTKNSSISNIAENTQISIRIPLNDIIGYSEMIIEDLDLDHVKSFEPDLKKIIKSSRALEKEIENIIQFKNVDPAKNINKNNLKLVEDVLASIKPISNKKNTKKVLGKVLAVDDNINNTDILKKRLEKTGHIVNTANDGEKALGLLIKDLDYDLILLDIVMPKMNGFDLLKVIKKDERLYQIPVIMISSMDDNDSIYRCIELGADDYVTKPFEKSILDARIISCIERKQLRDKEKLLLKELEVEKDKSDNLLLNILPQNIANRLKKGEKQISNYHDNITMIFIDIINFTPQAVKIGANQLVSILNKLFKSYDEIAIKSKVEKIKTIGDSYFAISKLGDDKITSAINIIEFAKQIMSDTENINKDITEMNIQIRIGIHSGPVTTGVIGKNKFAFDLWGASVNKASRLESTCPPGKIQISNETKELLGNKYNFKVRKGVFIKGIGRINTNILI
tara:strand:- start:9146 stop:10708 length:1563 start_codon:yes stop_codon:yes gene_type:complete